MTTREQIKEKIIVNGKLCHWCVNESWFDKKDIKYILDAIFLETKFLDSVASLRERIFYIQLDLYAAMLCPVCKNQVRINSSGSPKFFKSCGSDFCRNQIISIRSQKMWDERTVAEKEKIKTKISIKNKGRKLSVEHCEKIKERMTGKKQSDEYIQRRVEGRARGGIPYNTPQQIEKNRESNRKTHTSEEFKQKYKEVYEASRIKISHSMKEKIKNGEFTPPITNSWTRRKAYAINKSIKKNFRSSWEAVFWLSNPNLLFEKTRIPYIFEGKQRIYITDFTDEEKKVIYEIKPDSLRDTEQNIAKFKALSDWCEKNNYTCEIIGNSWFRKNVTRELLKGNKQLIKPMARFLND